MPLLKQDYFLEQPYSYCSYLGRIQAPHNSSFSTDKYGFRTAIYNQRVLDLKYFNIQTDRQRIFIAGNSVPFGVSVLDDASVIHNLINNTSELISYNLSMRASTMFQDFICLSRCIQDKNTKIVWIAGLNDLISIFLGDYSHPLFPPWFGEHNLSCNTWQKTNLELDVKTKFQLLVDSINQLILRISMSNQLIFVWQPLWSLRKSTLAKEEARNISQFFDTYSGKLGKLYKSKQLRSAYFNLIDKVESSFKKSQDKSILFVNSNEILPENTLNDVTHLNENGHASIATLAYNLLKE